MLFLTHMPMKKYPYPRIIIQKSRNTILVWEVDMHGMPVHS